MKKMKLTRSLMAACSIVALSAVMYGCVHDGGGDDPEPMVTPEPMPEPEPDPGPPADLTDTQSAAADAADAAMTASDNAAASAESAGDATATLATLQTGADANADEMGGNEAAMAAQEAADDAAEAASDAADAAAEAAAATTGTDAEAALRKALDAQDAAEAAEATAAEMAEAAIEAAMTELKIDGTMKSAGMEQEDGTIVVSSIDAKMGELRTPGEGPTDPDIITGLQYNLMREDSGEVKARMHSAAGATPVVQYRQAVEARDLEIGKVLDTTDDAARLVVVHSRAGSKMERVYASDGANTGAIAITTDQGNAKTATDDGTAITWVPELRSLGMYIEADQNTPAADDTNTLEDETAGDLPTALDHSDVVRAETKPKEVFTYTHFGADGVRGGTDDTTRYLVETSTTTNVGGDTVVTYAHVDVTAAAAPDSPDSDGDLQQVGVRAAIPMEIEYDHIHFGVWAAIGDPDKETGEQKITDLGIGWVQNIKGGVTERLGIGTVTFNGDWVAVIQRQNSAAKGVFNIRNGAASMTADFEKDEFTADLDGLAMLEGTLDGNGFSGMTATDISHPDLDGDGDFEGSFSGNIYGPRGSEAAGVFDFSGEEAGSFRGAFGGTNQD